MRLVLVVVLLSLVRPAFAADPGQSPALGAGQDEATPEFPPDPAFEASYLITEVEVRGNQKTKTALIVRELGLGAGDVVRANDPRVGLARLRLLALGYFLDVHLSLTKGQRRGSAKLIVEVEERGTVILDAIYLGTSQATAFWGGLAATERNLLGRGIALGGGVVGSTRPEVSGAQPGLAAALKIAGPPPFFSGRLAMQAALLASRGSEFFRARGADSSADPADFVALTTRRLGGTLGVGRALSRTVYVNAQARFESIHAELPDQSSQVFPDGHTAPIAFDLRDGQSHVGTLGLLVDIDSRSDPVLPRRGHHVELSLEGASSSALSSYGFLKAVGDSSLYVPVPWGHVFGIHLSLGGIWGDAPYFDRFFIGDFNQLLPPRALGLNFSTQPSRDLLGTGSAARRYTDFAARLLVEYAVPIWHRHGLLYRGDAFAAVGVFALADGDDLRNRAPFFTQGLAPDLTADLGVRLDTYIGIFTLSVANAIGRVPF